MEEQEELALLLDHKNLEHLKKIVRKDYSKEQPRENYQKANLMNLRDSFTSEFLKQRKTRVKNRTQKQFREQGGDAITSPDYYDDDDDDDDVPTTEKRRTIRGGILREYSNADVQRNEQRNPNAQQRRTPQPEPKQELESKARRILSQPAPQPEQELEEIPQPRQEIPQPTPSFEDEPDVIDEPDKPLVIPEPDEVDEFLSGIQPEEIERKKKPNITRPTLTRQSPQQEQKLHITSTRQEPILSKSSEKDVEQIKSDLEEQRISELEKQRISQLERQRIDEVLKEIEPEVKPKKDIQQKLSQQSLEENLRKTKEIDEMIKQQAKDRKFENREIEDLPSRKQKGQLINKTNINKTITSTRTKTSYYIHETRTNFI
jgi:hypothetical protein